VPDTPSRIPANRQIARETGHNTQLETIHRSPAVDTSRARMAPHRTPGDDNTIRSSAFRNRLDD
jgi:hypothetical protein